MKILIKTRLTFIPIIKNFFVKENGFQVVKNLIAPDKVEASNTMKFVILDIDNSHTSISLFNKINEQKLNVIKIDLSGDTGDAVLKNCKTLLNFPKTPIGIDAAKNGLYVCEGDNIVDNKAFISNDVWYKIIEYAKLSFPIFSAREELYDFPASKLLAGKTAFAVFDLNYSFCEDSDASSKRDLFSTISVYSSNVINDLFFAKVSDIIKEFREQDISRHIYDELVSPVYNKVIKKLRAGSDEISFIGLKDEGDNVIWLPIATILQYMDMPSCVFYSCVDKLKDKKTELMYEVPSLDFFTDKPVHYLQIRLEISTILFNFANILAMKEPAYNITTGKFEHLNDYEFYQD